MARLKAIAGALFGLVVLVFGLGFVLPSHNHVQRDILINAEPEVVFAQISDFHAWENWSPWANIDPNASMSIEGKGIGQIMAWASEDPQVGTGTQEIVELDAPRHLSTHLEFGDQGNADATFELQPDAGQTRIVWSLDFDSREGVPLWQQPVSTYVSYAMDMMIGSSYETGLQNLKAVVEG
ncbi:SRPBCC family protein [Vacuolonema iberomarrocanum]|uniref:SRPBCC family protein n=1 Tax=Vacuolonema iberomarrocanum TaxID=3454632 RepID=UPI0019EDF55B|nr:SRPBCC family protein [filamentous cyanobacterium LEGE 07170]